MHWFYCTDSPGHLMKSMKYVHRMGHSGHPSLQDKCVQPRAQGDSVTCNDLTRLPRPGNPVCATSNHAAICCKASPEDYIPSVAPKKWTPWITKQTVYILRCLTLPFMCFILVMKLVKSSASSCAHVPVWLECPFMSFYPNINPSP